VATCDVSSDSSLLLTGSADSSAKLWDVKTGACLFTWSFDAPCKAVAFGLGDAIAAISTDPFLTQEPAIHIVRVSAGQATPDILRSLTGFKGRINRVAFTDGNASLLAAGEDGVVRRWSVESGELLGEGPLHKGSITDLQLSGDGTHFVTSSLDTTAKLVDARTLKELKEYKTGTNANAAALHPSFPHVLVGGGQEASQVTTTSSRAGKFESRFFHKVLTDEVGTVRGHFGPINAVAFTPDGRAFATGGEDGYIRLHHFDADYLRIGAAAAKDIAV
jgi:translation initiation factor 3 subunit I